MCQGIAHLQILIECGEIPKIILVQLAIIVVVRPRKFRDAYGNNEMMPNFEERVCMHHSECMNYETTVVETIYGAYNMYLWI